MAARNSFERKNFHLLLSLFAVGALAVQACSDDENPVPSTPTVTGGNGGSGNAGGSAGKGGKGGASSGGTSTGGSTGNEGGTGDVGSGGTGGSSASGGKGGSSASGGAGGGSSASGGTGAVGEGGEGGSGAEGGAPPEPVDCDVRGDQNCYRCEPHAISPAPAWPESLNEQFHNHCSDAACSPFDNASRIEGWTGTLPTP